MNKPVKARSIQSVREEYIRELDSSPNSTDKARQIANDLFALDLTVYSNHFSLDSAIYSTFAESTLDSEISLHPEQIEIINQINNNNAIIISAPTSFGKTFCIFEYIAQQLPNNIVLIVPTLALVDEYVKRIIKKYSDFFSIYKVHTHIDEEKSYHFDNKNIFIITHDRVVQENAYQAIEKIDFLVIDEVYKLETDPSNDRVLVLNMAYYHLSQKAKKYVLLAPFIKNVEDIELLDKSPFFYSTTYSPVVNDVITKEILNEKDRYPECQKLILSFIPKSEKTLIYFPTVTGIYRYINNFIASEPLLDTFPPEIQHFLAWAKEEIHEEWSIIKAMERGYLIHNGQLPFGTRMFQLDYYENNNLFNYLLCTSTLLEGVNTIAKNIIITKPSRSSNKNNNNFSAFDFFNLVGRTGRLNQHYIGTAYYLKSTADPEYKKIDAIKTIKFEITDDSKDINIQKSDLQNHPEVIAFLGELGISIDEYLMNIGSKLRFETVLAIYNSFKENKTKLIDNLLFFINNPRGGRLDLVKILYTIIENKVVRDMNFRSNIINQLLNKRRTKIKSIINNTKEHFPKRGIDEIISTTINMKMSYIEHQFYVKVLLIKYFLELSETKIKLIEILNEKIIHTIEFLYFSSSVQRKMLVGLGVDERDVDKIINIIGDDFEDFFELKSRLKNKSINLKKINFISSYVIKKFIN